MANTANITKSTIIINNILSNLMYTPHICIIAHFTEKVNIEVFICPSGWHLPSSTGTGSYSTLVQNYVGRTENTDGVHNLGYILTFPFISLTRSGFYSRTNAVLDSQTLTGLYWTAKSDNSIDYVYYVIFYSQRLYPKFSYYRGGGMSLRCLAR